VLEVGHGLVADRGVVVAGGACQLASELFACSTEDLDLFASAPMPRPWGPGRASSATYPMMALEPSARAMTSIALASDLCLTE